MTAVKVIVLNIVNIRDFNPCESISQINVNITLANGKIFVNLRVMSSNITQEERTAKKLS